MKVLFDISLACHFFDVTHHGGGDLTKRHLLDMLRFGPAEGNLELFSLQASMLDADVKEAVLAHGVAHHVVHRIRDVPALVRERQIDRIYSTCANSFRGLTAVPCRSLLTIHGLRLLEKPSDRYEWCIDKRVRQRSQWLLKSLLPGVYRYVRLRDTGQILQASGDLFVAVDSRHTKYSIARFYPWFDQQRVSVFYPPALFRKRGPADGVSCRGVLDAHPFFLIVSVNRWIKNAWRTVHALDEMFSAFPRIDHHVALAGTTDAVSLGSLKNPERFHSLGYVAESALEGLYERADCLLYTSLNEGFGYPPVEAMKYGTPVIAAATTSICEVCGQGALYVNPYDRSEIINRCLQIIQDRALATELAVEGVRRHAEVSQWQRCDQQALFNGLFGDDEEWTASFGSGRRGRGIV